jgi:plastocyanin
LHKTLTVLFILLAFLYCGYLVNYANAQSGVGSVATNFSSSNNSLNLNSNSSIPVDSKNYIVKVGTGNESVSFNQYYSPFVEVIEGDSITWYNGVDVPNPHTVTFFRSFDNIEKISVPFYIQKDAELSPVTNNVGEPLVERASNGSKIIMILNARAMYPTVIDNSGKVSYLKQDPVYSFKGDEKFVNSGPLLSIERKQNSDYFFNNLFTVIFTKAGLYEYSCMFHPWMVGKVLVKPK